ncbi:hypothetical protein DICPUDRAFT_153895 [Dictyostelium purpureum]|uniref:Right handed beta helix domain-containing protein n=1 Tax=Dictyostelium purpureum TaxID=5786 RepID=F0ZQ08_DICPU|nr:uncharacterized protein DICPUDRAFT_153895 [Dictyostelium purpureum]EGC33965.1 hypothetical protein DICPUDRAFT_153895 [Dictyostelium purpureum]|eukprot:XP_003289498.1 hypothetical protein DICPUDRAFT_153895 [Dictyostelium purpureum]
MKIINNIFFIIVVLFINISISYQTESNTPSLYREDETCTIIINPKQLQKPTMDCGYSNYGGCTSIKHALYSLNMLLKTKDCSTAKIIIENGVYYSFLLNSVDSIELSNLNNIKLLQIVGKEKKTFINGKNFEGSFFTFKEQLASPIEFQFVNLNFRNWHGEGNLIDFSPGGNKFVQIKFFNCTFKNIETPSILTANFPFSAINNRVSFYNSDFRNISTINNPVVINHSNIKFTDSNINYSKMALTFFNLDSSFIKFSNSTISKELIYPVSGRNNYVEVYKTKDMTLAYCYNCFISKSDTKD